LSQSASLAYKVERHSSGVEREVTRLILGVEVVIICFRSKVERRRGKAVDNWIKLESHFGNRLKCDRSCGEIGIVGRIVNSLIRRSVDETVDVLRSAGSRRENAEVNDIGLLESCESGMEGYGAIGD
jgi:hypothetical protein